MSEKLIIEPFESVVSGVRGSVAKGNKKQTRIVSAMERQRKSIANKQLLEATVNAEESLRRRNWLNTLNLEKLIIVTKAQEMNLKPVRITQYRNATARGRFGRTHAVSEANLDVTGYIFGAGLFENRHSPDKDDVLKNISAGFDLLTENGRLFDFTRSATELHEYIKTSGYSEVEDQALGYTIDGLSTVDLSYDQPRTSYTEYSDPKYEDDFLRQRNLLAKFMVELEIRSAE